MAYEYTEKVIVLLQILDAQNQFEASNLKDVLVFNALVLYKDGKQNRINEMISNEIEWVKTYTDKGITYEQRKAQLIEIFKEQNQDKVENLSDDEIFELMKKDRNFKGEIKYLTDILGISGPRNNKESTTDKYTNLEINDTFGTPGYVERYNKYIKDKYVENTITDKPALLNLYRQYVPHTGFIMGPIQLLVNFKELILAVVSTFAPIAAYVAFAQGVVILGSALLSPFIAFVAVIAIALGIYYGLSKVENILQKNLIRDYFGEVVPIFRNRIDTTDETEIESQKEISKTNKKMWIFAIALKTVFEAYLFNGLFTGLGIAFPSGIMSASFVGTGAMFVLNPVVLVALSFVIFASYLAVYNFAKDSEFLSSKQHPKLIAFAAVLSSYVALVALLTFATGIMFTGLISFPFICFFLLDFFGTFGIYNTIFAYKDKKAKGYFKAGKDWSSRQQYFGNLEQASNNNEKYSKLANSEFITDFMNITDDRIIGKLSQDMLVRMYKDKNPDKNVLSTEEIVKESAFTKFVDNLSQEDKNEAQRLIVVAAAEYHNQMMKGLYDRHQLTTEEYENYLFKFGQPRNGNWLDREITEFPDFTKEPSTMSAREEFFNEHQARNVSTNIGNKTLVLGEQNSAHMGTGYAEEVTLYLNKGAEPLNGIHDDGTGNTKLTHLIGVYTDEFLAMLDKFEETKDNEGNDLLLYYENGKNEDPVIYSDDEALAAYRSIKELINVDEKGNVSVNKGKQVENNGKAFDEDNPIVQIICAWGQIHGQELSELDNAFNAIYEANLLQAKIENADKYTNEENFDKTISEVLKGKNNFLIGYQVYAKDFNRVIDENGNVKIDFEKDNGINNIISVNNNVKKNPSVKYAVIQNPELFGERQYEILKDKGNRTPNENIVFNKLTEIKDLENKENLTEEQKNLLSDFENNELMLNLPVILKEEHITYADFKALEQKIKEGNATFDEINIYKQIMFEIKVVLKTDAKTFFADNKECSYVSYDVKKVEIGNPIQGSGKAEHLRILEDLNEMLFGTKYLATYDANNSMDIQTAQRHSTKQRVLMENPGLTAVIPDEKQSKTLRNTVFSRLNASLEEQPFNTMHAAMEVDNTLQLYGRAMYDLDKTRGETAYGDKISEDMIFGMFCRMTARSYKPIAKIEGLKDDKQKEAASRGFTGMKNKFAQGAAEFFISLAMVRYNQMLMEQSKTRSKNPIRNLIELYSGAFKISSYLFQGPLTYLKTLLVSGAIGSYILIVLFFGISPFAAFPYAIVFALVSIPLSQSNSLLSYVTFKSSYNEGKNPFSSWLKTILKPAFLGDSDNMKGGFLSVLLKGISAYIFTGRGLGKDSDHVITDAATYNSHFIANAALIIILFASFIAAPHFAYILSFVMIYFPFASIWSQSGLRTGFNLKESPAKTVFGNIKKEIKNYFRAISNSKKSIDEKVANASEQDRAEWEKVQELRNSDVLWIQIVVTAPIVIAVMLIGNLFMVPGYILKNMRKSDTDKTTDNIEQNEDKDGGDGDNVKVPLLETSAITDPGRLLDTSDTSEQTTTVEEQIDEQRKVTSKQQPEVIDVKGEVIPDDEEKEPSVKHVEQEESVIKIDNEQVEVIEGETKPVPVSVEKKKEDNMIEVENYEVKDTQIMPSGFLSVLYKYFNDFEEYFNKLVEKIFGVKKKEQEKIEGPVAETKRLEKEDKKAIEVKPALPAAEQVEVIDEKVDSEKERREDFKPVRKLPRENIENSFLGQAELPAKEETSQTKVDEVEEIEEDNGAVDVIEEFTNWSKHIIKFFIPYLSNTAAEIGANATAGEIKVKTLRRFEFNQSYDARGKNFARGSNITVKDAQNNDINFKVGVRTYGDSYELVMTVIGESKAKFNKLSENERSEIVEFAKAEYLDRLSSDNRLTEVLFEKVYGIKTIGLQNYRQLYKKFCEELDNEKENAIYNDVNIRQKFSVSTYSIIEAPVKKSTNYNLKTRLSAEQLIRLQKDAGYNTLDLIVDGQSDSVIKNEISRLRNLGFDVNLIVTVNDNSNVEEITNYINRFSNLTGVKLDVSKVQNTSYIIDNFVMPVVAGINFVMPDVNIKLGENVDIKVFEKISNQNYGITLSEKGLEKLSNNSKIFNKFIENGKIEVEYSEDVEITEATAKKLVAMGIGAISIMKYSFTKYGNSKMFQYANKAKVSYNAGISIAKNAFVQNSFDIKDFTEMFTSEKYTLNDFNNWYEINKDKLSKKMKTEIELILTDGYINNDENDNSGLRIKAIKQLFRGVIEATLEEELININIDDNSINNDMREILNTLSDNERKIIRYLLVQAKVTGVDIVLNEQTINKFKQMSFPEIRNMMQGYMDSVLIRINSDNILFEKEISSEAKNNMITTLNILLKSGDMLISERNVADFVDIGNSALEGVRDILTAA